MRISYLVRAHFREKGRLYLLNFVFLTAGIIAGATAVRFVGQEALTELAGYFDAFLAGSGQYPGSQAEVTRQALNNNLLLLSATGFLGLTVVGFPLVLALVALRGFALGFTVAFLVQAKAFPGVLMALLAILPQNLVNIPVLLMAGVAALSFSLDLVQGRRNVLVPLSRQILLYLAFFLVLLPVSATGSLLEAYLSPRAIQLVMLYFK